MRAESQNSDIPVVNGHSWFMIADLSRPLLCKFERYIDLDLSANDIGIPNSLLSGASVNRMVVVACRHMYVLYVYMFVCVVCVVKGVVISLVL